MNYAEKLKHPKWQKARLKALESANYECSSCGASERTLHVHHGYYAKGREPWEYEPESLHVLCEECHGRATAEMAELLRLIGLSGPSRIVSMIGYVKAQIAMDTESMIAPVTDIEECCGIADALGATGDQLRWIERRLCSDQKELDPYEFIRMRNGALA